MNKKLAVALKVLWKLLGVAVLVYARTQIFISPVAIPAIVLGLIILLSEPIENLASKLITGKAENIRVIHRIIFGAILLATLHQGIYWQQFYTMQDSAPKQSAASMQIMIGIVILIAVYFVYFKVSKIKMEQLFEIILPQKDKISTKRVFTGFLCALVILIGGWMMFNHHLEQLHWEKSSRELEETLRRFR